MAECLSWSMKVLQSQTEKESLTQKCNLRYALCFGAQALSAVNLANQAVQSIVFMDTDQELWQEGEEENVQNRKMQLKNHIFTFYSYIWIITEGEKSHFNVEEERPSYSLLSIHLLTPCNKNLLI